MNKSDANNIPGYIVITPSYTYDCLVDTIGHVYHNINDYLHEVVCKHVKETRTDDGDLYYVELRFNSTPVNLICEYDDNGTSYNRIVGIRSYMNGQVMLLSQYHKDSPEAMRCKDLPPIGLENFKLSILLDFVKLLSVWDYLTINPITTNESHTLIKWDLFINEYHGVLLVDRVYPTNRYAIDVKADSDPTGMFCKDGECSVIKLEPAILV